MKTAPTLIAKVNFMIFAGQEPKFGKFRFMKLTLLFQRKA